MLHAWALFSIFPVIFFHIYYDQPGEFYNQFSAYFIFYIQIVFGSLQSALGNMA